MKHRVYLFLFNIFFICSFSCNSDIQNNAQTSSTVAPPVDTVKLEYTYVEDNDPVFNSSGDEELIQLDIRYVNFQILFNDYSAGGYYSKEDTSRFTFITNENDETTYIVKADTFKIEEDLFIDLDNKLIQIIPKDSTDHFRISFSLKENIYEQYDDRKFVSYSRDKYEEAAAKWEKNKVGWSAYTKYKSIKDSSNYFFRFPNIDYEQYEKNRKQEFHLRDTLVNLSGEGDNIATLVYKERACLYILSHALLRIERFSKNKLVETKYILIEFTSGC